MVSNTERAIQAEFALEAKKDPILAKIVSAMIQCYHTRSLPEEEVKAIINDIRNIHYTVKTIQSA